MPWALPQLDILVGALIALGVCLLIAVFVKAFFGVAASALGKLPIVGGWLDATAYHIGQRIAGLFGAAALKLEGVVGASWHGLARMVDRLGHELAAHAGLLATIASFLPGAGVITGLYALVHEARQLVARLAHSVAGIGHDVIIRTRTIERGIGNDVLPRIRSLEREVARDFTKERARARAAEKALSRDITNLWRWTRTHPWTVVTDAFVGAVAIALARLGLQWVRCPTAQQMYNKRGCNMWRDLEGLLEAALAVAATLSLVELAKAEQEVIGDISGVVRRFWQV